MTQNFIIETPPQIVDYREQPINYLEINKKGLFRIRTANECLNEAKMQPQPRELFETLIFEGEITLLFADTNIGKSIFAVQIGNEIAKTFEEKVLYIDLELSDKQFELRYSENFNNHFIFSDRFYRIDFQRRFSIPDGKTYETFFIESLKSLIKETGAKIIFIDNMTKLVAGDTDKAQTAKPLMDRLTELKFDENLTLILLEHTRKTDESRPISLNDLQGSKMKANFADAAFSIGRSKKDKNLRYVKQLKCRSAEILYDAENVPVFEIVKENSFLKFMFRCFSNEREHLRTPNEIDRDTLIVKVKEMIQTGKPQRVIANELGISIGSVNNYSKLYVHDVHA